MTSPRHLKVQESSRMVLMDSPVLAGVSWSCANMLLRVGDIMELHWRSVPTHRSSGHFAHHHLHLFTLRTGRVRTWRWEGKKKLRVGKWEGRETEIQREIERQRPRQSYRLESKVTALKGPAHCPAWGLTPVTYLHSECRGQGFSLSFP